MTRHDLASISSTELLGTWQAVARCSCGAQQTTSHPHRDDAMSTARAWHAWHTTSEGVQREQ